MSTAKRQKISSTLLTPEDLKLINKFMLDSGAIESHTLRGLIRWSLRKWADKKIETLSIVRLGAYSERRP